MIPLDPTTILLGCAMILLTASTTLSLLVHKNPPLARVLFGTVSVALLALLGVVAVDLFGAGIQTVVTDQTMVLSAVVATHRRLLIMLPLLLTGSSLVILGVYHERIAEKHARDYRNAVSFSTGISLIATILIAIEAMI